MVTLDMQILTTRPALAKFSKLIVFMIGLCKVLRSSKIIVAGGNFLSTAQQPKGKERHEFLRCIL